MYGNIKTFIRENPSEMTQERERERERERRERRERESIERGRQSKREKDFFSSRSRIFNITIAGERLQLLDLCSVFMAFELGGIFIVPYLP